MPTNNKTILQSVTCSLLLGVGAWIGLLLRVSMLLQNEKAATYDVTCGPFLLNTITRHEDAQGIVASISFRNGIAWYALTCVSIGILIGLLLKYLPKK
jgi:hypothetical protein